MASGRVLSVDDCPQQFLGLHVLSLRPPPQHITHLVIPAPLLLSLWPHLPRRTPDRRAEITAKTSFVPPRPRAQTVPLRYTSPRADEFRAD